jgi:sulfoxide reductase catalytic subunit YedY
MLIKIPHGWEIPERGVTPEQVYWNRREILKAAGFLVSGTLAAATTTAGPYPAKANTTYRLDEAVTEEWAATGYNNYYEFHPTDKQAVKNNVGKFKPMPWEIRVHGLVAKPQTINLEDLLKTMPFEERIYRFRCVEAWAMTVPWTGFPMSELIKKVEPKPEAKYLRFVTVNRPSEMPGMKMAPHYPWPYFEGLRMDEAMHPLAMFVTGIYGKPLPVQNGAPFRAVVPWKYGYKSAKSIVTIEFTSKEPPTFWNKMGPDEYGFYSNVDPSKPHPRWSQRFEKVLPNMAIRRTLPYNGYEQWVSKLYNGKEY